LLRVQTSLPMLATPVRMILQPFQPVTLIPGASLPNRFFRQQQNAPNLLI
jgi:hypothetical protein